MKGKKEQPPLSGTDERRLVELFLAGDEKAFDELVTRQQDTVYTLCVRIVGNREDAGDCAQDVFIKVYRNLKDFRFKSSLATWIYRIAVNTCRNHLASAGRRAADRMLSLDDGPAPGAVSGITPRTAASTRRCSSSGRSWSRSSWTPSARCRRSSGSWWC